MSADRLPIRPAPQPRDGAGSTERTYPQQDMTVETVNQPNQESRSLPPAPSPARSLDRTSDTHSRIRLTSPRALPVRPGERRHTPPSSSQRSSSETSKPTGRLVNANDVPVPDSSWVVGVDPSAHNRVSSAWVPSLPALAHPTSTASAKFNPASCAPRRNNDSTIAMSRGSSSLVVRRLLAKAAASSKALDPPRASSVAACSTHDNSTHARSSLRDADSRIAATHRSGCCSNDRSTFTNHASSARVGASSSFLSTEVIRAPCSRQHGCSPLHGACSAPERKQWAVLQIDPKFG